MSDDTLETAVIGAALFLVGLAAGVYLPLYF